MRSTIPMKPFYLLACCVVGVVLLLGSDGARAGVLANPLRSDLNEQVLMVPVPAMIGSVDLETTIFRPDGDGPFPLVVINHGLDLGSPAFQGRTRYPLMAQEFLKRGYAVVLPMRRGFSKSGGAFAYTGCSYTANGRAEAKGYCGCDWLAAQTTMG